MKICMFFLNITTMFKNSNIDWLFWNKKKTDGKNIYFPVKEK